MRIVTAALALVISTSAQAADIKIEAFSGSSPIVSMTGQIQPGDEIKFKRFADALKDAVVQMSGPGGNTITAMKIGEMISKRGYSTYIPPNSICVSSCALIWIAGKDRIAATGSQIGFHAAYIMVDGKPTERGLGNALVGAYLSKLGLSYDAIGFATSAGPNEVSWLTPFVSSEVGISYRPDTEIGDLMTADPAPLAPPAVTSRPIAAAANEACATSTTTWKRGLPWCANAAPVNVGVCRTYSCVDFSNLPAALIQPDRSARARTSSSDE